MTKVTLADLQESVQDKSAFGKLDDYLAIGCAFLAFVRRTHPTRIVSPSHSNYIFYQYGKDYGHKITRPLNVDLLTKLLGRDIPVIAIFLHDVQRAQRGNSIFGINSTFKSNHFLGYTVALNRLDGVYYVDPRPEMVADERLREQIHDFQQFLVRDLWMLSSG